MHPTYRFRFTPLGLALLFTVRDTHEGLSVLSALQLYAFGQTNPLVLSLLFPPQF